LTILHYIYAPAHNINNCHYLILSGRTIDGVVEEASKDAEKSSLEEQCHHVVIKRNAMQQLGGAVVRVCRVAMKVGQENNT